MQVSPLLTDLTLCMSMQKDPLLNVQLIILIVLSVPCCDLDLCLLPPEIPNELKMGQMG